MEDSKVTPLIGDTVEFLTFKTSVLEKMLKGYKTALFHELKISRLKELEEAFSNAKTNKERYDISKVSKETTKHYDNEIRRAEKYNCEISSFFEKESPLVDNFCEATISTFAEMTKIILKATDVLPKDSLGKIIPTAYQPALLCESEQGNIFLNGKKYKIYTNA